MLIKVFLFPVTQDRNKGLIFFLNVVCLQLLYVKHQLHWSARPNAPLFNPQFICKIFSPKCRHQASSYFLNFWHVNCRIKSAERFQSSQEGSEAGLFNASCQFSAAAYLLTFSVLGWEHCQKEMWGVCPTTCPFQNPHPIFQFRVFFCNAF